MLGTIKSELKDAMIAKDKKRMSTLRNILGKLKLKEIEKKESLTKNESLKVLQSMSKQLKDSIDQYKKGNREDLVQKETEELTILSEFLPAPIKEEELNQIIKSAIKECSASSMKDMGKVMGIVISKTEGRGDA